MKMDITAKKKRFLVKIEPARQLLLPTFSCEINSVDILKMLSKSLHIPK